MRGGDKEGRGDVKGCGTERDAPYRMEVEVEADFQVSRSESAERYSL